VVIGWLLRRRAGPAGAPFLRYRVVDMARELVVDACLADSPADDPAGSPAP